MLMQYVERSRRLLDRNKLLCPLQKAFVSQRSQILAGKDQHDRLRSWVIRTLP